MKCRGSIVYLCGIYQSNYKPTREKSREAVNSLISGGDVQHEEQTL